jgi:hypothetical protein
MGVNPPRCKSLQNLLAPALLDQCAPDRPEVFLAVQASFKFYRGSLIRMEGFYGALERGYTE